MTYNKVYEMRLESEINDIIYDCDNYLMERYLYEGEEVKPETPAQTGKKLGLLQRIINAIKKLIQRITSFFKSDNDKAVNEYKENAPAQGIPEVDNAAKRLGSFVQKEDPTKGEIEQAEKDANTIKEAIDEEKNNKINKKTVIKSVLMGGPILYSLYWKLYGAKKQAEKDSATVDKLYDRINNGEEVSDDEIDKATNKMLKSNIIKNALSFIGYICHHRVVIGTASKINKTVSDKSGSRVAGTAAGIGSYLGMRQTYRATSPTMSSMSGVYNAVGHKAGLHAAKKDVDETKDIFKDIDIQGVSIDDIIDI